MSSRTGTRACAASRARVIRAAVPAGKRGNDSAARVSSSSSGGSSVTPRRSPRVGVVTTFETHRKLDVEDGATPLTGRDGDLASVLGHDAPGDEEPETAAGVLGGEERVEDLSQLIGGYARARVGDRDDARTARAAVVQTRRDLHLTARAARLDGVQDDVHQHLLHLPAVDDHARKGRVGHAGELDGAPA